MGVQGWNKLADNVTLVGTVVDHWYNGGAWEGDSDWSLKILPDPESYVWVAVNSAGGVNNDTLVECEIRTIFDDEASEQNVFGPLLGRRVTAVGTWVEDVSHDYKTEIHPLMLLIAEGDIFGYSKRVQVLVCSDHSPWVMLVPPRPAPPHAGQSVHATAYILFPPAPHDDVPPIMNIIFEKDRCDSRSFSTAVEDGQHVGSHSLRW